MLAWERKERQALPRVSSVRKTRLLLGREERALRGAWGQSQAPGVTCAEICGALWRAEPEVRQHGWHWQLVNDAVFSRRGFVGAGDE